MTTQCPNEFPSTSASYRIALCGESPGEREVALRRPFVGAAGAHLDRMLAGAGILRSACFVGNVAQIRPPGNDFNAFDWRGREVQDGIAALLADLAQFAPNLVVTLGNVPLHLFKSGNQAPSRHKRGSKLVYDWPRKVTIWRGSLFMSNERAWEDEANPLAPVTAPRPTWKCLATLHPAFTLRAWSENFNLRQDLRRARAEGESSALVLPELDFQYGP